MRSLILARKDSTLAASFVLVSTGSDRPSARRYVFTALKIAVSIVLLTIVLDRVDLCDLWAHARSASLSWIFAGFVVYVFTMFAGTWRWHLLLEAQNVSVSRRWLFGSFLVANFFN